MKKNMVVLLMLVAARSVPLGAQHQQHQMAGQPSPPAAQQDIQAAVCVQSQQRALAIVEQASRRVEAARRSESPGDMRSAIDDLQAALNQMRSVLQSCGPAPDSTATSRPSGSAPLPKPATVVDHAAMGHVAPAPQAVPLNPQLVSSCVQTQQTAGALTERLTLRLEMGRQTNSVAEMRAGVAEVPAALGELRTSLQGCEPLRSALAAAAAASAAAAETAMMDHSKMQMGGAPAAAVGAKPSPQAAPMDHSKMPMAGATPAAKPGAARGAKPGAPMDHSKMPMSGTVPTGKPATAPMDHSKMPMPGAAPATGDAHAPMKMDTPKLPVMPAVRVPDPACPNNITQPKAPKAVYQRKVYYFCSAADRDQFLKDPAAYLKRRPR